MVPVFAGFPTTKNSFLSLCHALSLSLSLCHALSLSLSLSQALSLSFFLERTSVVKWCDGDTTRDQKISFSHFVKERKINRPIYGNWLQILRGLSYLRSGFWRHFGNLKGVEKVVCVKSRKKWLKLNWMNASAFDEKLSDWLLYKIAQFSRLSFKQLQVGLIDCPDFGFVVSLNWKFGSAESRASKSFKFPIFERFDSWFIWISDWNTIFQTVLL